eukprot:4309009-Pleurochrysis_carterae.AAC.1
MPLPEVTMEGVRRMSSAPSGAATSRHKLPVSCTVANISGECLLSQNQTKIPITHREICTANDLG